jgi:protein-tyrosine kinase
MIEDRATQKEKVPDRNSQYDANTPVDGDGTATQRLTKFKMPSRNSYYDANTPVEGTSLPGSQANFDRPLPVSLPDVVQPVSKPQKQGKGTRPGKLERDAANAYILREQSRQINLSLFFREHAPIRSLGFTSSLNGEGKSFLAMMTASLLANDSSVPVTLLECNWENPFLHQHFGFAATPGLAEWLRAECSEAAIRYQISRNLTVIPAGDGKRDAVRLLQQVRQRGLSNIAGLSKGLLVVDLPSIVTSAYGSLAASLVESLIIVVRAGVTPDIMLAETCTQLKALPVHGVILNQAASKIPHWIRQML